MSTVWGRTGVFLSHGSELDFEALLLELELLLNDKEPIRPVGGGIRA
eukprot:SAG11_NODE_3344_length_2509_cov_4.892946_2_plen_47_part_00